MRDAFADKLDLRLDVLPRAFLGSLDVVLIFVRHIFLIKEVEMATSIKKKLEN